jgi:zinc finger protein
LRIVELDFEIPASKSKGSLNTLEGFIANTIEDLKADQDQRRVSFLPSYLIFQEVQPEVADKIDEFIKKLENILTGVGLPVTFIVDDPSGNSYIKNPLAPNADPQMKVENYDRSAEQLSEMGYSVENAKEEQIAIDEQKVQPKPEETKSENVHFSAHKVDFNKPLIEDNLTEDAMSFPTMCHSCGLEGENKMCTIAVPYFKELIIMSFNCEYCGVNSREVKVGG